MASIRGPAKKMNSKETMPEFYKVAKVSEVPPGTKHLVEVDFVPVLLFQYRW